LRGCASRAGAARTTRVRRRRNIAGMTDAAQDTLPHMPINNTPAPGAEDTSLPLSMQRRELAEMRTISARLDAIADSRSRKRILDWLVAHYGAEA